MTVTRASWFAATGFACMLMFGCSEKVEKDSKKAEGQGQALREAGAKDTHNADAEGKAGATKSEASTSPELTLQPSNPATQAGGGASAVAPAPTAPPDAGTSPTATSDTKTTQTAEAPSAPADGQPSTETAALGGATATPASGPAVADAAPADLSQSPSPYLRAAAKQQIQWQPFSAGTFAAAGSAGKPVLIDIGANYSHPARQMQNEAYADPQVISMLNDKFTCVKVDADQQPDVARRYRAAHKLINNRDAELPLTVFALPDGRPFDILSYVPAKSAGEQSGMVDLLTQVEQLYTGNAAQLQKQADLIEKKLAKAGGATAAKIDSDGLRQTAAAMAKAVEAEPAEGTAAVAMYLLHIFSDTGDKTSGDTASKILLDTYKSPLRDQVLGGYFHPLAGATEPHFEKLLPVQSGLLSANALAFAANKKSLHKEAAEEILRFCRDTLEAQGGGFYASQDADAAPGDNGSYFTWTRDEILQMAGNGADAKVFAQYLNAGDQKAPLFVTNKLQSAADANGVSYEAALKALKDVRLKLRDARMQQENVPNVNKAILASWNAEAIMAYLDAYKYLGDAATRDFALQTADYLINNMVSEKQGVAHVFYKGKASEYGLLEDNVKLAAALMQCFEVSGQHEYLESAESLMGFVETRFLDKDSGLYADRSKAIAGEPAGLQRVAMMPVEDAVAVSSNAMAAQAWYALYQASSKEEYREKAERIVQAALGRAALESPAGATMGRVATLVTNGAPKVLIIAAANDKNAQQMHDAALPVFRMGKLVEMMTPEDAAKTDYPPAKDGSAIAYVCTAKNCAPPVKEAGKIVDLVKTFGKAGAAKAPATEVAAPGGAADGEAAAADKKTM